MRRGWNAGLLRRLERARLPRGHGRRSAGGRAIAAEGARHWGPSAAPAGTQTSRGIWLFTRQHSDLAAVLLLAEAAAAEDDVDLVAQVREERSVESLEEEEGGESGGEEGLREQRSGVARELKGRLEVGRGIPARRAPAARLRQSVAGVVGLLWRARDDGGLAAGGVVALNQSSLECRCLEAEEGSGGLGKWGNGAEGA